MAITFYTGHDEQYALIEQGTWGTAGGDSTAGQGFHIAGWDFKPDVKTVELNTAKAQRYLATTDLITHERGSVHTITLPTTPFLKDQGDKFLYGVIQNVSEGTATPYVKTFTFGQTQPDFSANAGYFVTLVNKMPVASTSIKASDCVLSELNLSCAPGANDGMLVVDSATYLCRSHIDTSNYTGTITYPDVAVGDDFYWFHSIATKTIGGTAVILGPGGVKISIKNGAVPVGGASGLPQTFALTMYRVDVTIDALWDATLRTSMASHRAGTAEALILDWGTAGQDEYLSFTLNMRWNDRDLSHAAEGEFVTLTGTTYGVYGTTQPATIVLNNAIDRTW